MKYYFKAIQNYSNFADRTTRTEFWVYALINIVFIYTPILISMFIEMIGINVSGLDMVLGIVILIYGLASLVPTIAITIRRLHDSDNNGLWILVSLIPYIGGIILLIFCLLPGTKDDNKYGSNPRHSKNIVHSVDSN